MTTGSENCGTRFVVQWEEHPSHLSSRLGRLLEQQILVDVTLMCSTHTLRVHRSVLAACSPYFENLLQNIAVRPQVQHPLIVLKDMKFTVLKCLIEFMYCGETNVTEEDLGPLLQAARFFQVKGLNSMTKEAVGLTQSNAKKKINGDVVKTINKPGPKPVSTPVTPRTTATSVSGLLKAAQTITKPISTPPVPIKTTTTTPGLSMLSKTTPTKSFIIRDSSNLHTATNDSAQLLLSLSADQGKTTTVLGQSPKTSTITTNKQMVTLQTKRPTGAAVDSAFQLVPNQPEGTSPVYQPGPRKRGRPLKQQMDLLFQEKVITDAELALRKQAEASRRVLETLQKEISNDETTLQVLQSSPQPQKQSAGPITMTSKLVPIPPKQKPVAAVTTVGAKKTAETTTTAAAATPGITFAEADSGTAETRQGTKDTTSTTTTTTTTTTSTITADLQALKDAGIPEDEPILLDSGDGNYVHITKEMLMNLMSSGELSYQVTDEPGGPKQQEGEILVAEEEGNAQMQQQVVQYVDENGEIQEGILAVLQEGEEGTTVAVTPSGQVLQIQAANDGESYQLVEAPPESNSEGLISGDLEPPAELNEESAQSAAPLSAASKPPVVEDTEGESAAKKMKVENVNVEEAK